MVSRQKSVSCLGTAYQRTGFCWRNLRWNDGIHLETVEFLLLAEVISGYCTDFSTVQTTSPELCQSVSWCLSETWSFCQPYLQAEFHLCGAVTIQFQRVVVSVPKWNSGAASSGVQLDGLFWTAIDCIAVMYVEILFTSINNNEFYILKSQRLFLFYFLGVFSIFFSVYFSCVVIP